MAPIAPQFPKFSPQLKDFHGKVTRKKKRLSNFRDSPERSLQIAIGEKKKPFRCEMHLVGKNPASLGRTGLRHDWERETQPKTQIRRGKKKLFSTTTTWDQ